ncbi:MAG: hypothetical protein MZV70_39685 [Desulfobacterales bacterium]|nr:hypothetical protein [Desulfobacterales bacterium]
MRCGRWRWTREALDDYPEAALHTVAKIASYRGFLGIFDYQGVPLPAIIEQAGRSPRSAQPAAAGVHRRAQVPATGSMPRSRGASCSTTRAGRR